MFSVVVKKINLLLVASFFIVISIANAQPPVEPPGGPVGPGGSPTGAVPVDGGLVLLLAAGAGYGAKKAYDYRKNKVKSEK